MAAVLPLDGSLALISVDLVDGLPPSFHPFPERSVDFASSEFFVVVGGGGLAAPCSVVQGYLRPAMAPAVLLDGSVPCAVVHLFELFAMAAKAVVVAVQRSVSCSVLLV